MLPYIILRRPSDVVGRTEDAESLEGRVDLELRAGLVVYLRFFFSF